MTSDEKKYQVFVSSTYQDLEEERREVIHALLELDCIPSGMELFPATNDSQWSLIKGVIDDCDYYIVIIGGRYGSIAHNGISYTEMEYRYALEKGKPIAAFLHGKTEQIPAGKCESTDEGKTKLAEFRKLTQNKMCKFWTTPHELGSVVSRSLVSLRKQNPGIGWVRGDRVLSSDSATEILRLRKHIEELESELTKSRTEPPKGTSDLAQKDDVFDIYVEYETHKWDETDTNGPESGEFDWKHPVSVTWNNLFFIISPLLLHEATTEQIHLRLTSEIRKKVMDLFDGSDEDNPLDENHAGHHILSPKEIKVSRTDLETVVVQFLALGYIVQSTKNRSVKDRGDYWTLTPFGTTMMNNIRAIRSEN